MPRAFAAGIAVQIARGMSAQRLVAAAPGAQDGLEGLAAEVAGRVGDFAIRVACCHRGVDIAGADGLVLARGRVEGAPAGEVLQVRLDAVARMYGGRAPPRTLAA